MKRKLFVILALAALMGLLWCAAAQAEDPGFVQYPTVGPLNPSTRTYPVSFEANFIPYRVAVSYKKYSGAYYDWTEFYSQTTGLSSSMTIPVPAEHGGEDVLLELYYGESKCKSDTVTLGPDDPRFVQYPSVGSLNPSTRTYPVSFEANFIPYRVAVSYKKYSGAYYDWTEFYSQTTGLSSSMTIPVPAEHGGEDVLLELYYGESKCKSDTVTLGPDDPRFVQYPSVGLLNPSDRTYPVSFEANFIPYRVAVSYKKYSGGYYDWTEFYSQTTGLSTDMTIPVPGEHGGEDVLLELYYGESKCKSDTFKLVSQVPVITFDARGGTVEPSSMKTDMNGKLASLPTPVRERFNFNYWYAYFNGQYTILSADTVYPRNTTAYASWTPIYHSVTIENGTASRGAAEYGSTVTITANEKTGMVFTGWEVLSGDVTLADATQEITTFVMGDEDVRIRANYEYIPVTVTFDPGEGTVSPTSLQTGTDGKLPSIPRAVREGYVLAYWYYPVNNGSKTVTASSTFSQDTTCHAVWSPRWYKVVVNGGSADCGSSTKTGQTVTITANERENYAFSGWTVVSGGVSLADASASTTTFTMGPRNAELRANYTYTGQYLTDLYVFVEEPIAGEAPSAPYTADDSVRITSYRWIDAATQEALGAEDTFQPNADYLLEVHVSPESVNLPIAANPVGYVNGSSEGVACTQKGMAVAMIEKNFYVFSCTVSFDSNGGAGSMDPVTVYQPAYTLPACGFTAPENCEFTGWDLGKPGDEILLSEDVTLTAQWRQIAGDCGENLIWRYDSDTGTLTISGEGDMTTYSSYTKTPWWGLRYEINTLVVSDGVTSISNEAFFQQFGLSRVTLGDSVAVIGSDAFAHCGVLAEINLPEGLTSIGGYAFYMCKGLQDVKLPASLVSVGASAFAHCEQLRGVTVPEGVTSVGNSSFAHCDSLEEAVFLGANTVFGTTVFNKASASMIIRGYAGSTAETYATANNHTFQPFTGGALGDDVTWSISPSGKLVISGIGAMADFTSTAHSPLYDIRDQITSVVIEEGVTTVGAYVFDRCAMNSVSLPDSVTSLGTGVFARCANLEDVVIPSGVQAVPGSCFQSCTSLRNITLPENLAVIGAGAFMNCTSIEDLYFVPESVESFGNACFYGCTGLTSIFLPRGMTSIPNSCFGSCTSLTSVGVPSVVTEIRADAFSGGNSLSAVYYEGVRSQWNAIDIDETGNESLLNAMLFCKLAVVFDSMGGSQVESQALNWMESADEPAAPSRMGYIFDGWYADEACAGEAYDFAAAVTEDITLYAKWIDPSAGGVLKLPAALTAIEDEAFAGVSASAAIIPPRVTSISGNPFSGSAVQYVYGVPGSPAMILAYENGLTFVPVDEDWLNDN